MVFVSIVVSSKNFRQKRVNDSSVSARVDIDDPVEGKGRVLLTVKLEHQQRQRKSENQKI